MQKIEYGNYAAEIDELGAQLTHLKNISDGFDYIWNNELWPKHAPILFPAIGRSNDDSYLIEGRKYSMPQHGFAADQEFDVVANDGQSVKLRLNSSNETKTMYPYDFVLDVTFSISDEGLKVQFNVENKTNGDMSYSLGYHPAFNIPIDDEGTFKDYHLDFNPMPSQLDKFEIVKKPNPYRSGNVLPVKDFDNNGIDLNYEMFDAGLVILTDKSLSSVEVSSKMSKHSIKVHFEDFDYLTLWTKEGAKAPFLCIEPFNGLPDVYGGLAELSTKEANHHLADGQEDNFSIDIELN
ncbi:aldose 1-epimerase family protein [Lentilactobacillus sp. Marseille-Q4993]|uniref:aldose 1-epimerase family protein n=1 Tax=Lentilactobacillus sp. Marseille-Q4993 TaxID=3039492 RepID=UPI0024BBF8B1|nr:aldose 1-epimerase family protein [Lentilactobacillus sp. Marseille-Q4993]